MKKILPFFLLLLMSGLSYGQLNPVKNLNWYHGYDYPYNLYSLYWDQPDASATDSLKGYNVYRDGILWRFQTGIGVSCMPPGSCLDPGFLLFDPFWIKVTAVYNSEGMESIATDSIQDAGFLIGVGEKTKNLIRVTPNPVQKGATLRIWLEEPLAGGKAILYNYLGVTVRECTLQQDKKYLDLQTGGLPSGCYFILVSRDTFSAGQRVIIN